MKSNHSSQRTFSAFTRDFSSNTRNGFDLIDLKIDNGYYLAAYGKNIGKADTFVSKTTGYTTDSLPDLRKEIAAQKADGYELTDLEYSDGEWHSIYATNEGDSELIEADTYEDIKGQLLDLEELAPSSSVLNYQIADIEYAGGRWYAVANYAAGDATYEVSESPREFLGEIRRQKARGLELVNLEYVNGDHIGIYSEDLSGESIHSQGTHADIDDFTAEIEANRDRGYHLINTETINGSWFGIYKQDAEFGEPLTSASGTKPVFDPAQDVLNKIVPTFSQ